MTILDRESAVFFHTYKRLPLDIDRGIGPYLYTRDGKRFLDMFGGIAVNALGHAHPRVVRAICDQASRYIHVSNYFAQEPQVHLAELLTRTTGYPRVFFCNSGTEATEGALKIARKWGSTQGKTEVLAFTNSFHGRTMGALSLMDRPNYRDGFGPFLPSCSVLPFNDPQALRGAMNDQVAAVMLEFIQGEGGIRPVSPQFVETVQDLRTSHSFLLIGDEVQSGIGRTGKFLACEHFNVKPDLVTLAKPIGGGLPVGAILGTAELADVLQPGNHGTTFGGNPVACAAGAATIEEILEKNILTHVQTVGDYFRNRLLQLVPQFPSLLREVRGLGLMVGVEMARPGDPVVIAMRDRGVLINCTDSTVLRFVPPLIVGEAEIDLTVSTLADVFRTLA